jgi:hypothetical protein
MQLSQASYIQIFSLAPCSQISTFYVLPLMWEAKTTGKTILYILIHISWEKKEEDKRFWTEW